MPVHDDLGNRMKKFYEEIPKTRLMRRCPVIIRTDMRCGHTFLRKFKRPFDDVFIKSMQDTMKYLCENIQGCKLGYAQSDEISLLLTDYDNLTTAAWFDYEVQKICSISASMATMAFNKVFSDNVCDFLYDCCYDPENGNLGDDVVEGREGDLELGEKVYAKAANKGAMFDSRCFNIPKEEVTNYFFWRQLDASRNSVEMVGRTYFSHKQLYGKSNSETQDILMTEKGVNWNDLPTHQKRGSCCIKEKYFVPKKDSVPDGDFAPDDNDEVEGVWRSRWIIDKEIPIFKGEGREYIECYV